MRPTNQGIAAALALALATPAGGDQRSEPAADPSAAAERLQVRMVTDEAEAALAILALRAAGEPVTPAAWTRLWESEAYRRLKRRQESFGATAVDEGFRDYLLSPEALAAAPALTATLARWRSLDLAGPARRASAYLPDDLPIRATVYPVIKRSTNSFVFEVATDPAIFFHLDPAASPERVAGIVAHELHHVGTAGCSAPADLAALAPAARAANEWLGGLLEGVAVLAAAGGPDAHPHANGTATEWIVWQRDMARFGEDLEAIATFLRGVAAGGWDADEQRRRFFALINTDDVPQGPFYTVGWGMAALVEKASGRRAVVESVCDPRRLLVAYDAAARAHPRADGKGLPTWDPELLRALGVAPPAPPAP